MISRPRDLRNWNYVSTIRVRGLFGCYSVKQEVDGTCPKPSDFENNYCIISLNTPADAMTWEIRSAIYHFAINGLSNASDA